MTLEELAEFASKSNSLYIECNEHKSVYESAAEHLDNLDSSGLIDHVSAEERQVMIDADSIWWVQWYPITPIAFYNFIGPTLEDVCRQLEETAKQHAQERGQ